MANNSSLRIHAGLNPGELFIQAAKGGSNQMIVLPPAKHAAVFAVVQLGESGEPSRFALCRKQRWSEAGVSREILENILEFPIESEAQNSLVELTSAIMMPEPSDVDRGSEVIGGDDENSQVTAAMPASPRTLRPNMIGLKWLAMLALLVVVVVALHTLFGRTNANTTAVSAPAAQVASPANVGNYTTTPSVVPTNTIDAPAFPDPSSGNATAMQPAAPVAEAKPIASPGDEFMQQATGQTTTPK
jgi:hypothetical protein